MNGDRADALRFETAVRQLAHLDDVSDAESVLDHRAWSDGAHQQNAKLARTHTRTNTRTHTLL